VSVRHYLQDAGSTFGTGALGPREWDEGYEHLYEGEPTWKRLATWRPLRAALADGFGGVTPPLGVTINGGPFVAFADPAGSIPLAHVITGLNVTGPLSLQILRRSEWIMVSEVQFEGTQPGAAVPEPGTITLVGVALAGVGLRRFARHRR
jgi:hypothetical protein